MWSSQNHQIHEPTVITHHHPSSPIITHHHPLSLIITHYHPSSLIITHYHPSSPIIPHLRSLVDLPDAPSERGVAQAATAPTQVVRAVGAQVVLPWVLDCDRLGVDGWKGGWW
jgi:hypothetical protein